MFALRAMAVVSIILFKSGYFLGLEKCHLIPEKLMTSLGIECDSLKGRFTVHKTKYLPLLQELKGKDTISYSGMEQLVGKLVSLECAVPAGMWSVREQYSAMRKSGVKPDSNKSLWGIIL